MNSFSSELSQEEMNLTVSLLQKPELSSGSTKALHDYIRKIREQNERSAQSEVDLNTLGRTLKER